MDMRNLYLYLALNSACLIGLVGNFLGLNYYPQLNITAQSNFRISSRERELLAKVISQGFQINEAELDPQDADQEIYLYRVLYKNSPDSQWQNLCKSDGDNLTKAMLLWGEWDEKGTHINNEEVTIACTSGVLAKCVRWGYKPWKTLEGIALRDYHQACTRMARADYCGNGISHTKDGTIIDHQKTEDNGMVFEAAWGTDGAILIHRPRYSETLEQIQLNCPEKLPRRLDPTNQSLTQIEIQQQFPTALMFNDSFVRKPFQKPTPGDKK